MYAALKLIIRYLGRCLSLEAEKHHLPANRLEPRNDPNNDKNTSKESGVARVGPTNDIQRKLKRTADIF